MLTDSGGFQVFSLNQLRKVSEEGVHFRSHLDGASHFFSPEHSIDVQMALGADIIMAFDECTEYPADRARARQSLELTLRWAKRSQEHFLSRRDKPRRRQRGDAREQALFGIVQGGTYPDLRRESRRAVDRNGFARLCHRRPQRGRAAAADARDHRSTLPLLPADKPRYVMGVGYPEEIVEYAALGVDMMDCVMPTRAARHGLLFTSEGRLNIKNRRFAEDPDPLDPECGCMVCRRYSRAYLRHLFAAQEPLAAVLNTLHNLAFYLDTMRSVRDAIRRVLFRRCWPRCVRGPAGCEAG